MALDSSIFIYYIEENPQYLPLVDPIFDALIEGRLEAVTCALTLLETGRPSPDRPNEVLRVNMSGS